KHRPSIAAFGQRENARGLQVVAAWGNTKFFQWDSSKPPQLRTYRDGQYNSVLRLDEQNFIAASADQSTQQGRLSFWRLGNSGLPESSPRQPITFPRQGNEIYLPLSCATIRSGANQQPTAIAVALCVLRDTPGGPPTPERFQLRIVSIPDR